MADAKKYLDLNGLSYTIRRIDNKKADLESPVFTGTPTVPTSVKGDKSLQIANTQWVDNNYVGKEGDATINGTLTVIGKNYPLLTLKSSSPSTTGYLMNIQGNLMFGDCTSNNPSRQYYGRMVPALGKAVVGAVAIGYNPKDNANYQKTTDYGIKIDVDIASATSATPTIERQCASFFVGVNGGYIGYSENVSKAVDYNTQVYRILDSNNIKTNEYIASLEQRIVELESKLTDNSLEPRVIDLENKTEHIVLPEKTKEEFNGNDD